MILLPRAAEEFENSIRGVWRHGPMRAALSPRWRWGAAGMKHGDALLSPPRKRRCTTTSRKALVAASELDTRLVMRAIRNTERVLKNAGVERFTGDRAREGRQAEDRRYS